MLSTDDLIPIITTVTNLVICAYVYFKAKKVEDGVKELKDLIFETARLREAVLKRHV